jgi:hypothetical protein
MDRSIDSRDEFRNDGQLAGAEAARLTHLTDLKDFKVADGDPDIRGWSVKTSDGVKLGKVIDLLVDGTAMKVRYMEVALDKRVIDLDEDRHVLVPIGAATLNDDDDVVLLSRTAGDLTSMPEYKRGTITVNDERVLYDRYGRRTAADAVTPGSNTPELYDEPHFDDRQLRGSRNPGGKDSDYIVRVKEYVVRNDQGPADPDRNPR